MVTTPQLEYQYFTVRDSDLDMLLRSREIARPLHFDFRASTPLRVGETGVLVGIDKQADHGGRPLALFCRDEDIQRLCGRYAHVRAEFSPLSAWCHLLSPAFQRNFDGVLNRPRFGGTVASWSGLVVAEALLLSARPLASIRISACLASATYAIGRAQALWSNLSVDTILERFDLANKLCRGPNAASSRQARVTQVRVSFDPLWRCLAALNSGSEDSSKSSLLPLIAALNALSSAKATGDPNEAGLLAGPLLGMAPELSPFGRLTQMTAEERLTLFDQLVARFKEVDPQTDERRNALALATGYLATVAAGGAASLALLEDCAEESPELTGWAYLVGGIGERITWSSGFDGLGRLIAREFHRPLRLDDPPTCDFSFDEAKVLADDGLKDPLVHLRIKQAKVLSVSLFPGVNIAIPVADTVTAEQTIRNAEEPRDLVEREDLGENRESELASLAAALWPYLLPLVIDETTSRFTAKRRAKTGSQETKRKGKSNDGSQLPLTDRRR